tara:strand:- start:1907 stop:2512 length:606 start_codon:yes stop_codon:yes gene_type:complete
MLKILSPETFKTIPWKNGLGHTTELAINSGGNLDNFDWRLSIASVVNDGEFSNFSGYQRDLVLIEGEGIILDHGNGEIDNLTNLLDISHFDGGSDTYGSLVNGGIKDFNVMTNENSFTAEVNCYVKQHSANIPLVTNRLIFAYSLNNEMNIEYGSKIIASVPVGHLAQLQTNDVSERDKQDTAVISGKNMIIIELTCLAGS